MRTIGCPSCGTSLSIDDRFALFVVCESCDSTVVVDEGAARIHGRMGALSPPEGVLYLGATGEVSGLRFQVVGRVRYGYSRGYWNEWLLSLEDGRSCWISEDEDELELESLVQGAAPGFGPEVRPGDFVDVSGTRYRVSEKDQAVCEGGEGMLPFPVVQGESFPYLELTRSEGFATVEFPPTGPRVFVGQRLDRGALRLDTTRQEAGLGPDVVTQGGAGAAERVVLGQGRSRNLNCDACGAPLEVPATGARTHECEYCGVELDLTIDRKPCASCSKTLPVRGGSSTHAATCPHCGTLVDVRGGTTQVLLALSGRRRPGIPLKVGMRGTLFQQEHEIIGHMRLVERDSSGTYSSNEFLLRRDDGETVWIVLEEGHYSYRTEIHDPPGVDPRLLGEEDTFQWDGRSWEVDDQSEGASETIDWVEGEFTWVPRVGDRSSYMEAESPPFTLIAEWTEQEMEWYRGRYVSPAEIAGAFGLSPDSISRPSGPRAGAPEDLRYPPVRIQLRLAFLISFLMAIGGASLSEIRVDGGQHEVPALELLPAAHRETAEALDQVARQHREGARRLRLAEVEVAQAKVLDELSAKASAQVTQLTTGVEAARKPPATGSGAAATSGPRLQVLVKQLEKAKKAAFQHGLRAAKGRKVADEAVRKTLESVGLTVPGTYTTDPSGQPLYPLDQVRSVIADLGQRQAQLGELLPPAPKRLPPHPDPGWPARVLPLEVERSGTTCEVHMKAPLEGDWVHLDVTLLREGQEEPVGRYARTLLSSSWNGRPWQEMRCAIDEPGRYQVVVRGFTGWRGSDRLAPLRSRDAALEVQVRELPWSPSALFFGAGLFFLWGLAEVVFRGFQVLAWAARCTVRAVGEVFS